MLKKLFVQNYALIESLEIDFSSGFSVITGETGSGKSILLGALSLILGDRADHKVLFNKDRKCIIEGFFASNDILDSFLNKNDIDVENELIIRREIASNGKSRAFINDSPVKLELLRNIGSLLIDVHGQHENLLLGQLEYQYLFLDSAANTLELYNEYYQSYLIFEQTKKKLNQLLVREEEMTNKIDYINFQINELNKYPFENWDEKSINEEYNLLSNFDNVKQLFGKVNELSEGSNSIMNKLNDLNELLGEIVHSIPEIGDYQNRMNSICIEMEDLLLGLGKKDPSFDEDPIRLEELNNQIMIMNSLMKKFNVVDLNQLKNKKEELVINLSEFENISNEKEMLQNKVEESKNSCLKKGSVLYNARIKKIKIIEKHIDSILARLSMPNASLKLDLKNGQNIHQYGIEQLGIYISTNKGDKYHLINDVASGGELSRILLSMKTLLSNEKAIPTMIFDEIDSGVSGKVANEIGIILKELSLTSQVICITHLPQVAAIGSYHYHVIKETDENRTYTKIRLLKKEDRLFEIASMLGGEKPGKAAIDNASELLN